MHVPVLRVGGAPVRLGIAEIADDRVRAARGDMGGLLVVAHERRDVVPGADERVENGRADVAGGTGQEEPHGSVTAYFNSIPPRQSLTRPSRRPRPNRDG